MTPGPPASDLGAIRARCTRALQSFGSDSPMVMSAEMLSTLLAHIDAQAARLAAVEQVVADNQWIRQSHGVTRANRLRPRGYCTACGDKHPCDSLGLLEDIEAALAAPPGESP